MITILQVLLYIVLELQFNFYREKLFCVLLLKC